MGRKLPRFVQAWVDREGRSHHYFRRRGYPRTRLPGLPWSAEFMLAHQAALDAASPPIGVSRSPPGSLSAAIASYYGSQAFRSLTGGTPAMRRAILGTFSRASTVTKPIALLPKEFIVAVLDRHGAHSPPEIGSRQFVT